MAVTVTVTDSFEVSGRQETVGGVGRYGRNTTLEVDSTKQEDGWGHFCSSDVNHHGINRVIISRRYLQLSLHEVIIPRPESPLQLDESTRIGKCLLQKGRQFMP